jgi:para-aminobenzoate synthetase component I
MLYQLSHVRIDTTSGTTIADSERHGQRRPGRVGIVSVGIIAPVKAAAPVAPGFPCARLGGLIGSDLVDLSDDPRDLDRAGRWAVVMSYEGRLTAARFAHWAAGPPEFVAGPWCGPSTDAWRSSMSPDEYLAAVQVVRQRISLGEVYQANVCRILSADLPDAERGDLAGLHACLAIGNPAPYQGFVRLPGLQIATASPELFLERDADSVRTGPIKGTGRSAVDLRTKDEAENIMIVDLMRNDLSRVCRPGTVFVPRLLVPEQHPGLVHLVSEVRGKLKEGTRWPDILAALMPPGSVSGAPKGAAVRLLADLEPTERGPYCGAIGWVDADSRTASLAVGIRTFWRGNEPILRFGTGAGITWDSDPAAEWEETQLKAERLLSVAAGKFPTR